MRAIRPESLPLDVGPTPLAILGASVRAAAVSAWRSGLRPIAADLFGDRDLQAIADWQRVPDYPRGFLAVAGRLPRSPWIYTGGLENHPELIDALAARNPLLGNSGEVLRAVRDPWQVAACLRRHGLHFPESHRTRPQDGSGARWLRKPLDSSGGGRIREVGNEPGMPAAARHYYQRVLSGPALSAVYVAGERCARLWGVTRQWTGVSWTGARPFAYCGSLGPLNLHPSLREQLQQIGHGLAAEFALKGLFGVDTILVGRRIFVLEVNPRYTASVEVLEQGLEGSALRAHVEACRTQGLPDSPRRCDSRWYGKAILFAREGLRVPAEFTEFADRWGCRGPWSPLADVPATGTEIGPGRPLVTLRATAGTAGAVRERLQQLAEQVRAVCARSQRPETFTPSLH